MLNHIFNIVQTVSQVPREAAVRFARVPGVRAAVHHDRCVGCAACVRQGFCRFGSISVSERKARVDEQRCRGCGRCTHLCPKNAFALEIRPPELVTKALRRIDHEVTSRLR